MEYRSEKPLREDRYRHQRESPSFSSTLLDAIYRSIDESGGREEEVIFCRESMRKKQNNNGLKGESLMRKEEEITSYQRACMIEKWMEKRVSYEKVAVRRKSTADSVEKPPRKYLDRPVLMNSSSSSSDSSSGGGFSSSESESIYGHSSKSSTTWSLHRPRPIRTSVSVWPDKDQGQIHSYYQQEKKLAPTQKSKLEGGLGKTKSKALKIYGDLKKVKQPISPGGKLASFLNSLFTTGNAKKAKISSSSSGYDQERKVMKSERESTCSSASSFSRSCLSKTPSSGGKLSNNGNGAKRTVRFYPFSVIVDEDSRPCGHKSLYGSEESLVAAQRNSPIINEELKFHVMSENRQVEEAARELLKNYHHKKEHIGDEELGSDNDDEEDDDDGASYASSDLFELDNLSSIGIDQRYREELPVYETTHLGTNRAIANGLIV